MSSPRSAVPIALIGAGKHGERYLRHALEDVADLRVAVLCRRDAAAGRAQAAAVGARYVADFREAATAPDVAGVVAVVPPFLHVEICRGAAAAGKAILVEKPLAISVESGLAIRAAAAEHGVPLMVAHTLRFNSVVARLRDEIPRLGALAQVCLSQRFEPSSLDWLDDPARSGGGIVLHTGVHSFDLLRFLTGENPSWVVATTAQVATRRTEDNFAALLGFGGRPLTASVAGSRSTASRAGSIEISGERGQLFADHHHGTALRIEGMRRIDLGPIPAVPTVRETLAAFAAVLRGAPAPITVEDGLWAVAVAEACYRSAADGARVPVRLM